MWQEMNETKGAFIVFDFDFSTFLQQKLEHRKKKLNITQLNSFRLNATRLCKRELIYYIALFFSCCVFQNNGISLVLKLLIIIIRKKKKKTQILVKSQVFAPVNLANY